MNETQNKREPHEFRTSILALLTDTAFVILILLLLGGISHVLGYLTLGLNFAVYFYTLHEWTTALVLTIYSMKIILRLAIRSFGVIEQGLIGAKDPEGRDIADSAHPSKRET
jgi:hypothetical protein